ncbi:MAG: hypothetical protein IH840_15345, partial [Candidatus Heimdallarchaeota archaeon]|nr:hypothetical protein [Candidatus Heimdallarchaeota archaeon]
MKREVNDLILVTFVTLIFSTLIVENIITQENNVFSFITLLSMLVLSYGHVVGKQMSLINDRVSLYVSYLAVFVSTLVIIGLISLNLIDSNGFWKNR